MPNGPSPILDSPPLEKLQFSYKIPKYIRTIVFAIKPCPSLRRPAGRFKLGNEGNEGNYGKGFMKKTILARTRTTG
jgi:hypothetical protein